VAPADDRTVRALTLLVAALMLASSAGSLLRPEVYRDNALVAAGWLGNDLVTLVVAAPSLIALAFARSARAGLLRSGVLAYALYNFAFYLFGAALNPFFLFYAATVALALTALGLTAVLALQERAPTPGPAVGGLAPATPHRAVAGFMLGVVMVLGGFWLVVSAQAALSGRAPSMVVATGAHTNVIAALDLTLVVPTGVVSALWLGRGQPFGLPLAVVWNIQGALYMAALTAATATAWLAGALASPGQALLWGLIGGGSAASSWLLLRSAPSHGDGA
jgi:hypothetical protein